MEIPETDSIFGILDLDPKYEIDHSELSFDMDYTMGWVINLRNGVFPSGNQLFDDYMTEYSMVLRPSHSTDRVFTFDYDVSKNINPYVFAESLETIEGIKGAVTTHFYDPEDKGDSIVFDQKGDIMEISITVGYGNCANQCENLTTWVFDCPKTVQLNWSTGMTINN